MVTIAANIVKKLDALREKSAKRSAENPGYDVYLKQIKRGAGTFTASTKQRPSEKVRASEDGR